MNWKSNILLSLQWKKKRTFFEYKFNFYIKQNWVEFRIFIFDKDFQGFIQVELINKAFLT